MYILELFSPLFEKGENKGGNKVKLPPNPQNFRACGAHFWTLLRRFSNSLRGRLPPTHPHHPPSPRGGGEGGVGSGRALVQISLSLTQFGPTFLQFGQILVQQVQGVAVNLRHIGVCIHWQKVGPAILPRDPVA